MRLAFVGQLQMEKLLSDQAVFVIGIDFVFGSTYVQFNEVCSLPQSTNLCKVDHQAFSFEKYRVKLT